MLDLEDDVFQAHCQAELVNALEALLKLHEAHHNCPEHAAARAVLRKAKESQE